MFERCCINDLKNKEVINTCDGRRLGFIVDVEVNVCDGRIVSIAVPGEKTGGLFTKCDDLYIPWCKIQKIGDDIILVDIGKEWCRDVENCNKGC